MTIHAVIFPNIEIGWWIVFKPLLGFENQLLVPFWQPGVNLHAFCKLNLCMQANLSKTCKIPRARVKKFRLPQ